MSNIDDDKSNEKKFTDTDYGENPASKLWRLVFFSENQEAMDLYIQILHKDLNKDNNKIIEFITEMEKDGQATAGYYVPEIANTLKNRFEVFAAKNEISIRVQIEIDQ